MGRYDLSRLLFYSMRPEELWAARRIRQFEMRMLRRQWWRLAFRLYGIGGGLAVLVVVAAAAIILLAGRATPDLPWLAALVGGGAATVVMLAAASSSAIDRQLRAWKRELDDVGDRLRMHKDSIRVLDRHLRRVKE